MDGKLCVVIYLLISIGAPVVSTLENIETYSRRLDELLVGIENVRYTRDSEENVDKIQDYEFGTVIGNREELVIENVITRVDPALSESIYNYQLVENNDDFVLACSNNNVFSLYKLDPLKGQVTYRINVYSEQEILTFKLLSVPNAPQSDETPAATIIAILCVGTIYGTELRWYRFTGQALIGFSSWPVQNRVERLEFFNHDKQNKLMLLFGATNPWVENIYSMIDIFGFSVVGNGLTLWLSQRMVVPRVFDFLICPTYEKTMLALQLGDKIVFYEYKTGGNEEGLFHEYQTITAHGVNNAICFESGYISYFATSGHTASLINFFEGEFRNSESEDIFTDVGKVSWIQSFPMDTYREESILLVQLENSTIVGFSWNGQGFERISQPDLNFGIFPLYLATVIPKYGFVFGNVLVKFITKLREQPNPIRQEMEKLLNKKNVLAELLRKQELILDETQTRIDQSYFANPEVTGFWNISEVEAESVILEDDVVYDKISMGMKNMTPIEFFSDLKEATTMFDDFESKLVEIESNLANAVPVNSMDVVLTGDLVIDGSLEVRGTLSVTNEVELEHLNGLSLEEIVQDFSNYDDAMIIEGEKTFASINADNLNVLFINDVPMSDITFSDKRYDWSNVDFSRLTKLKVEGDLRFNTINGVDWKKLLSTVVMKSQPTEILGDTVVDGDLIADNVKIHSLNGLRYPGDYVLANESSTVHLTGHKTFRKLTIDALDLEGLKTINGISMDEYVTLGGDTTLSEEITFDNLVVTDTLQIDGEIEGLPESQRAAGITLKETSDVITDVVFAKLTILGDLEVEYSINGIGWSELDDLVSKTDEYVEITGQKIFLDKVEVPSNLIIESQTINGHAIEDFVTLDTEQVFPNLETISGNVTFVNIVRGDLESLKKLLMENIDENGRPKCLNQSIRFNTPPIVENLFLNTVNGHSLVDFTSRVNATFSTVHFQNLDVENLRAREISSINLNGMNYEELKIRTVSKSLPQTLTGDYEIDFLKTELLLARTIDGFTLEQLEDLKLQLDRFYDQISNGNLTINDLEVNGTVNTVNINGKPMESIFTVDAMGTVIFPEDVYIENLTVHGFINGINFTDFANDAVLKTDSNIVITGNKIFDRINCKILEVSTLNGKDVELILDPNKHQIITGSMKVNGTVRILENFESLGKIGGVSWPEIQQRFQYLGNSTYALTGDFRVTNENVSVENLVVTGSIDGVPLDNFLDSVVYKNSTNVIIHGPVIFTNSVTIDSPFTITETLNELNLKYFYENAVRIDRPFSVKSKVIFTENIVIEKNLIADEKLEAKMVGGIDLSGLYATAAYADRPTFISGAVTLENVVFESDIEVEFINKLAMRTLITLNEEQTLSGPLHCMDIAVGKLEISGTFNGHDLDAIYENTFTLTGNQNISGHLVIIGNVSVHHDFDASLINGVNPSEFISLNGNETLIGNFVFEKPLIVHGDLVSHGLINDVDVAKWQATAVTKNSPFMQIVTGAWKIHGNVHFAKDVFSNSLLNDVNVTNLANELRVRHAKTEILAKDAKKRWMNMCKYLITPKKVAENQIYKYKYFDYLQVLNFDRSIVSVHHVESNNSDYLLVNFVDCRLDIFVFMETEFVSVASFTDVGQIERWFTFPFEKEIYFLTVGNYSCNKNSGNLWKFAHDRFTHVYDLGNVTDARKISDKEFLLLIDGFLVHRSKLEINQTSLNKPRSHVLGSANAKFVSDSDKLLLVNRDYVYEYDYVNGEVGALINYFGTDEIASFRLGVDQRETFVYYDESLSEDYLFISDNNVLRPKILQTIRTEQPSSILVLNFDRLVENFLIVGESRQRLQIHEYRGIEGFIYRETVNIGAERLFKFKFRKYPKLAKINCIVAMQERRLVILEAKMYGARLDMGSLPCEH